MLHPQGVKSNARSSELSDCHASLLSLAQQAQQDRPDSQDSDHNSTQANQARQAHARGRALGHSPSGKGSSSLDHIIPQPYSPPADSDGDITLSAGTDRHSVGAIQSAGGVTQSAAGVTNDSSQACSSVQLAQGGKATAMAQLAEAAAAICSEEKALQHAQHAG